MTPVKVAGAIGSISRSAYHTAQRAGLPVRWFVRTTRTLGERTFFVAAATDHALAALVGATLTYRPSPQPLCIVVHDAHRHGAQLLGLALAEKLFRVFHVELHIVILGPGPLAWRFRRFGRVYQLDPQGGRIQRVAETLADQGVRGAICNSVASGLALAPLNAAGIRCVALVHELPQIIQSKNLHKQAQAIQEHAAVVVFPSAAVRDNFPTGVPANAVIRPQGLAQRLVREQRQNRDYCRGVLRRRFGVPATASMVLSMGYGDLRKGIDLFVQVGARVIQASRDTRFIWVGDIEPEQLGAIEQAIGATGFAENFILAPFDIHVDQYLLAADVFALTSREDPFPTVLLQALDAELPVVAFERGGGFADLLNAGAGFMAPHGDADGFAQATISLLQSADMRRRMGKVGRSVIQTGYSMRRYAIDLAALTRTAPPRVSVIVPNFNYARYLRRRLRSIIAQTLPPYELIVLDDCSTDNSLAVAEAELADSDTECRIIAGHAKAGSVFEQWRRGVNEARGDFVWIAEADDLADWRFLETVVRAFTDPDVVLSYCQSQQIDDIGRILDTDYLTYTSDIDANKWRHAYVGGGLDEIRAALAVKNTVPNVSACIFRRASLLDVFEQHFAEISRYRVAGDWMTYIRLLTRGRVAYHPRALNRHRRHQRSVTARALTPTETLGEIENIQNLVVEEFAPTRQIQDIAAAYNATLRRQFGLD